ncbi:MAG TPA: PAS domain S-box protein [Terriglobia bacterium]|nr:PAS domain S-box protein [Terriglobia bacterium]
MPTRIIESKAIGYPLALLGIAVVTSVCVAFHLYVNDTTVALAMLLTVLLVAIFWGSKPALVASFFGLFCLNFFFLMSSGFSAVEDTENLIALTAFLATSLTVGQLSARAKQRAAEAEAERKEAKRANAYNRSLLEAAIDPLVTIGQDGKITDVNPATEAATGHSRAELIGTDFSDYFADPALARAGYQKVFREGVVRNYALEMRHRDGRHTPVLYSASVYRDEAGEVAGVFAAARDIAEQQKAESALRESEANLRKAQGIAHVGSWLLDISTNRFSCSDEVYRMFGLRKTQAPTYEDFLAAIHPDDREMVKQAWGAALRGSPFNVEHRILVGGRVKWVRERGTVEFDELNKAVRGIGTVQDVTERRIAEDLLRKSSDEIHDLYNNAPCGYHSVDPEGTIVRMNYTELSWLGYSSVEIVGRKKLSDILTPESRKAFEERFSNFKDEGVVHDVEMDMVRKDGSILPVLLSSSTVRDRDGNYVMSRSTVYDITARRRAEEAVRRLAQLQTVVAGLGEYALKGATLDKVMSEAVVRVSRALGTEFCQILELLPGGDAFVMKSGVGWKLGSVGHFFIKIGEQSQAGFTLFSAEPVVIEDYRTDKRFVGSELLSAHGVVSGASVVIMTKEGPYGVLGAYSRAQRSFTSDEVSFLQAVSNILGSAIERYRAETQLLRINRANRALSLCNEAMVRATNEAGFLQRICDLIVEEGGYRFCWVGSADSNQAKSVCPLAQAGSEKGYLSTLKITWADTERGRGPTGTSIRTRQTVLARNIATDAKMAPWRADALKRGYGSSIAIPLLVDSGVFGALNIYAAEAEAFGDEEVHLLTELATDLAFGITALRTRVEREKAEEGIHKLNAELEQRVIERTAELQAANTLKDEHLAREQAVTAELEQAHEREAELGYKIQRTLLLDQPPVDVPGLRVASLTIPSQRIDGDFYVFFRHRDQCLDVIVGDVMGKGIPAALVGAATKSYFLKALSHLNAFSRNGRLPEPKEIVMLSHAEVVRQLIDLESFVTLTYARLDVNSRRLDLVDCGHTGIVQVHGDSGACDILHGDNLPLGVREGEIYDQVSVSFTPGDLFFFYSDGITEARNDAGELFGVERLLETIKANSRLEPASFIEAIRDSVVDFSGGESLADDLTGVAVRVEQREIAVAREDLEIRSDLRYLGQAREFVNSFCRNLPGPPLSHDSINALELAVNEAACNIMKHAYHGRSDRWIYLEGEAFPSRVALRLYHLGDSFDPSELAPPALDGSRESGFGAYIISKSTDDVRYYRDERGMNCISLVKMRKSDAGGKTSAWK